MLEQALQRGIWNRFRLWEREDLKWMGHGYRTNKEARRALKLVLLLGQTDSSAYGYGSTEYSSSKKNLLIMLYK